MAVLLVPAAPTGAQVLYGSLVGRVTDTSQAGVPGATVTLIHPATNLARETTTRRDGGYRFINVHPGTYTVRVALAGFKAVVSNAINT